MPKFSIIIPTYNSSNTIRKCLNSLISQSYKDLEVIIVDGQSNDNTIVIIQDFLVEHKEFNIKIISEKDRGIYDAMNKGINISSNDWIYFLGSDDYLYDSQVLHDISCEIEATSCDLIYGNAVYLSSNKIGGGEFDLDKLLEEGNICHQVIFYNKRIFNLIGYFNLAYPIVADWDFNIRCFSDNKIRTHYIKRVIVLFNDITGLSSISRNDPFYKKIPAPYIWEINQLKQEKEYLINTPEYKLAKKIRNFLVKISIISILKRFNKMF